MAEEETHSGSANDLRQRAEAAPGGGERSAQAILRIVLPYVLFAGLWILLSDRLLGVLPLDAAGRTQWSIYKGWAFVLVTALLLSALLRAELRARARDQAALRQSEERLRSLGDNLPDSYVYQYTHEADGIPRFLYLSAGVEKLHGVKAEDVLRDASVLLRQIAPEQAPALPAMEAASLQDMTDFTMELRVRRSDGQWRWLQVCSRPRRSSDRQVLWDGVVTDITTRKRVEEELRATQASLERRVLVRTTELAEARDRAEAADRIKSVFLATMSHELRTPLNSIIGFTGLLLQGLAGPLNAEQTKQLQMVKESGRHLLALINDVLDISKIEAGQIEVANAPFDLPASIKKVVETVRPLANKKLLPLIARIAPGVGWITSDRRRVEQILLNLLSNAIKFTERGEVVLSVMREGEAEASSEVHASRFTYHVSVRDTGIGIRPDDLDNLFQPFRQLDTGLMRQHEGTGLGLAICKRLVERLGGAIEVESEWGKGSTFRFTLPTHPEKKS